MTAILPAFLLLSHLGTWLPEPAPLAQTHTLSNGVVELKLKQSGSMVGNSNLWLTSIKSAGGQTIACEEGEPLWIVEVRTDPAEKASACHIVPEDLPLSVLKVILPNNGQKLIATWGPGIVNTCGAPQPNVRVVATWTLKGGEDTASTAISVLIQNPGTTEYRLWATRYPRVLVRCLDGELDGSDRLAIGRNCGVLYGDPIHYAYTSPGSPDKPLRLTQDPDHEVFLISPDGLEPGVLGIPASTYYDATTGLGLYHSNDDDEGYVKGIYWTQEPGLGPNGSLLVQTVQFPTGDIEEATSYSSPYQVQLAALDRGDWIGAAQKYRRLWRSFDFYPGPVGSEDNHLVSQDLKDVPIALWLDSGDGYCIAGPSEPSCPLPLTCTLGAAEPFDFLQAQGDLDGLAGYIGIAFPFVYLNRYCVDVPHEVLLEGYVQSPSMLAVRELIQGAESAGHRTVIHTMTEKTFVTSTQNPNCCSFCLCNYCDFDDGLMDMYFENALVKQPGSDPISAPCSRGEGKPTPEGSGINWPAWFVELNATFSNQLVSTGGLGWTAPNPTSGWCFSERHAHEPGFGNFQALGWLELLESTAQQVTTTSEFARTMETSNAFFSQAAGVQNTWNFDLGRDFNNFEGVSGDFKSYDAYHDAPIWRIPMMQMAVDNAVYASVYSPPTLRYPYAQPYWDAGLAIFDEFPAVTGALACWSMAERVLSYQSVVYLNNDGMVPLLDLSSPGTDDAKNAAADMYAYYRGLAYFLMGSAPVPLIDYHVGSLERPPAVTIDGVTETFVLDLETTIQVYFSTFSQLMNAAAVFGLEPRDLDWSKYQPFKHLVGQNDQTQSTIWLPAAPEVDPTYLPNGMYRHHSGLSLAFFLSNPWGVRHVMECEPLPCTEVPLNPFTFNYGTPASSPSNTYSYRFVFNPADYEGFPVQYQAAVAVYGVDGQVVSQTAFQTHTGSLEFTGTLAPHQSAAWVFRRP